MYTALLCLVVLIVVFVIEGVLGKLPGTRAKSLPPGPPCLPLIGNLHQLPPAGVHLKFTEWATKYGGIFSLKLGASTAVILSSPTAVKQLIDKQSAHFSNRPPFYIADELMMHGDHLMFMNVDQRWRRGRRLYHQYFNEGVSESQHVVVQQAEAAQLLRDMCLQPGDFMAHCKRYTNSVVMSLILGIRTKSTSAKHMKDLYAVLDGMSEIFEMGATPPVDIFPVFKHIPESLFNNWQSRSRRVEDIMLNLYNPLVNRVLQRRETSGSRNTYLDGILDQQEKLQLTRHEIDLMVGNLLEGGSDTSSIMTIAFIQAMACYPGVQQEAQQEIDALFSEDASPSWQDYARLPYVAMAVKETMRWRPVMPTGFPHANDKETMIDGMVIPANSTVIINTWGLHHDPTRHPNPNVFDPLRFQGRTEPAPVYASAADAENRDHFGYGSGRRICPGIHLAERMLFVVIVKILWAFDIRAKKGQRINTDPHTGYTNGFLRCAKPFAVSITPRSEARRSTIEREFAQAEEVVFSRYEV